MTETVKHLEDLRSFGLDPDQEDRLLREQTECTICWTTRDGSPMAVIMTYHFHRNRFWLSCSTFRKRVAAIRRDPRVVIVVSSAGTDLPSMQTVTYKGRATLHETDDVKQWFYRIQAERVVGQYGESEVAAYISRLDTPNRVIIEVEPGTRVSFDAAKAFAASADPRARTERSVDHA
jgi:general stress protein 26